MDNIFLFTTTLDGFLELETLQIAFEKYFFIYVFSSKQQFHLILYTVTKFQNSRDIIFEHIRM